MATDFNYWGDEIKVCDNDSSRGGHILGGGGGCFKGKATKEVTIKQGYDKNVLELCNSCAIRIIADAKRHGASVSTKPIKKKKGMYD